MTERAAATNDVPRAEVAIPTDPATTPFKNTTTGKTIRTLLQNLAGLVAVVTPALMASDDFRAYITNHSSLAWVLVALPVAGAAFTFIQNAIDPNVPLR